MKSSAFDFVSNLDTLLAVIVGALLATVGGVVSDHIQDHYGRRRRERDAARFFAEIMVSIDTLVDRAIHTQKFGDPWGPVTMRLFRTAMREAEIYDRNRERLFDIGDVEMRTRIHHHVVSEIFPLEAMIEGTDRISAIKEDLDSGHVLTDERRAKLIERLDIWLNSRKTALAFITEERQKTHAICTELGRLADVKLRK